MPDQSSASTEHALMQEITAPLANIPDDPLPIVTDVDFPVTLRGYDRIAVDAYVRKISQLVAELQATRSPEAAVRRALERVGSEVSGILQRAHDTAEKITTQSRSEAEDRLEVARKEAAQLIADAHARVKDLDAETDRIWAERQRIVEDTRELAQQLLGLSDTAGERFPPAEESAPEAGGGEAPQPPEHAEAEDSVPEQPDVRPVGVPYDRALDEATVDQAATEASGEQAVDQAATGDPPSDAPDRASTVVMPTVAPADDDEDASR